MIIKQINTDIGIEPAEGKKKEKKKERFSRWKHMECDIPKDIYKELQGDAKQTGNSKL